MRFLRVRHEVTVEDAYASPLCEEGVDGFLQTLGLGRYRRFPGWLIAWLFVFDRQVGFVLYEARQRWLRERSDDLGAGRPAPRSDAKASPPAHARRRSAAGRVTP